MVSPWTKKGTVKEEEDNIYDDDMIIIGQRKILKQRQKERKGNER